MVETGSDADYQLRFSGFKKWYECHTKYEVIRDKVDRVACLDLMTVNY